MKHEPKRRAGGDRRATATTRRGVDPEGREVHSPIPLPKREPAAIRAAVVAAVTAVVHTLVVLGVVDVETERALVPVIDVVGLVVAVLWIRFGVTANAKVVARVSTSTGTVVAGDAAAIETGSVIALAPTITGSAAQVDEPVVVSPAALPVSAVSGG